MKKPIFYILSLAWGLPMTLCGAVVALILILAGHKPRRWGGCRYFNIGKNWGGLSLGLFFFTDSRDSEHTKNHEFGHAVQNCYLGPVMVFLSLGSAVRYHYRNFAQKRGKPLPEYDAWWFEGQATKIGYETIKLWEVENYGN